MRFAAHHAFASSSSASRTDSTCHGSASLANDVAPSRVCAQRENGAHCRHCTVDVERARNDVCACRIFRGAQHAIHGAEQLAAAKPRARPTRARATRRFCGRYARANRFRRSLLRASRMSTTSRTCWYSSRRRTSSARGSSHGFVAFAPRQQHLRLDADEARRHLEIIRRFVEPERRDARQELLGDARDGNVVDVDLLVANEREKKIERAGELSQLDDENFVLVTQRLHHVVHWLGMMYGETMLSSSDSLRNSRQNQS